MEVGIHTSEIKKSEHTFTLKGLKAQFKKQAHAKDGVHTI